MTTSFLRFTKMHGLGNDFVVVHEQDLPEGITAQTAAALAAQLCHRQLGVGSDGLIVVAAPSSLAQYDTQFVFYNSDGSRAEMCGNGIRCFTQYLHEHQLLPETLLKQGFRVETLAGLMQPQLLDDCSIKVNMGPPVIGEVLVLDDVLGESVTVLPVSMGNPHALIIQNQRSAPLDPAVFGPVLEVHAAFPNKTNVEFIALESPTRAYVTVWERGCGFTLACGTGACATGVGLKHLGLLAGDLAEITLPGGTLNIEWAGPEHPVYMTGPATTVFTGEFLL